METEVRKGFGWFTEKNRTYHIASCRSCGASVRVTEKQRFASVPEGRWLEHLDVNIPCCKTPDYHFEQL